METPIMAHIPSTLFSHPMFLKVLIDQSEGLSLPIWSGPFRGLVEDYKLFTCYHVFPNLTLWNNTLSLYPAGSGVVGQVGQVQRSPLSSVGPIKPENTSRAIMGSAQQQQQPQSVDLVKLMEHQRMHQQQQQAQQQAQQQRQVSLSPASPSLQRTSNNFGVPITGRMGHSPTPMVHPGSNPAAANALLLQRMLSSNLQTSPNSPRPG